MRKVESGFTWEKLWVGQEFSREFRLTPELVQSYLDGVEDANPWWQVDSPFGGPVAPPLMLSHLFGTAITSSLGPLVGGVHTMHDTEILAPARVGSNIRLEAKIVDKFEKRERRYIRLVCRALDEAGNELCRETRESLVAYTKVSGEGSK